MVKNLVDKAFDGSVEGLVMTLLEERELSSAEADRIRKIIDQSESKGD